MRRAMLKIRPRFLIIILTLAIAVLLINRFVCGLYRVSGGSMTPTLLDGDWCLVWKFGAQHLQRGDVVFFRNNSKPYQYFVKRIVALPHETISIEEGQVFIDGVPLPEPYTTINKTWWLPRTQVPYDFYYFIGDHRSVVISDHLHGQVASRNIQGRMIAHWRF
jgi:signal peptidase I